MLKDPKWDRHEQQVTEEPWRAKLRSAADSIERDGWWNFCNNDYGGDVRGHCAVTAIGLHAEAKHRLADFLGVQREYGVSQWNDTPGRTKEQVISALRAAAES